MLNNLKALAVILPLAIAIFVAAKPVCLRFMTADDFARRRNVWLILTIAAFISPDFWLFALVALMVLAWATSKESNPTALFLLVLLALPPVGLQIPTLLINQLFELSCYRVIALGVLVPAALRLWSARRGSQSTSFAATDKLLIAFAVLQLLLLMPYESITNTVRRTFLFLIDAGVLYYVASRACSTRRALTEAMACFCLAGAILVPIAAFEALKGWLLYTDLAQYWGRADEMVYLFRSGALRAQVSTGHSLSLGWFLAVAFGFWLYLRTQVKLSVGLLIALWFWVGLIAAHSRGPWLAAALIFFVFIALGPKGLSRFVTALVFASIVGVVLIASPIGDQVIDSLPFVGTVDAENVAYRQELAAMSWELIKENPLLGSPYVLFYLESLRQGQGIIDLVNSYATIAMYYGITGFSLFVGFSLSALWNAYRLVQRSKLADPDQALLGASLIGCMAGMLFFLATDSFGRGLAVTYWILTGLAAGFGQLGQTQQTISVRGSARPPDLAGNGSFGQR